MRASALLLLAAIAGACASPDGDHALYMVFDPCEPVALVPAPDLSEAELDSVLAGAALWNERGAATLVLDGEIEGARPLAVHFEPAASMFYGVYEDSIGAVFINRRLPGARARAITVAHEIGHAFGLPHVTDRVSLMNPGNLEIEPTDADLAALRGLWGACEPRAPEHALQRLDPR